MIPLGIAIIAVWVLGHHYYQKERGILFQSGALHLAQALNQVVEGPIEELHDWLLLSDIATQVQTEDAAPPLSDADFNARIQAFEARWPALSPLDPELRAILTNNISQRLKEFQAVCPMYAEIFVTDAKGRLIGSTGKTTDYWQAEEDWWQKAFQMPLGHAQLQGIDFDDSARVYSLDVAFPIYPGNDSGARPIGVLKGVINISSLFAKVQRVLPYDLPVRQVVQDDGRILIGLFGHKTVPLQERISADALNQIGR